jgi:hypothetical protein
VPVTEIASAASSVIWLMRCVICSPEWATHTAPPRPSLTAGGARSILG